MVFQNIGMAQLGMHLSFGEGPVEMFLGLFEVPGGPDADDLDCINFSIALALDFVDFCKTALPKKSQVLEIALESLDRAGSTSVLAIFWKSKPSIGK